MGVAGAFFGTLIQGLLDLAAEAIISSGIFTASESLKQAAVTTTTAVSAAGVGAVAVTEGAKQVAYGATATVAGVAGAAEGAAAGGPAAPVLLPIFIAAALAAIGAALSGTKGKVSGGGGGSKSPITPSTATPSSVQGSGPINVNFTGAIRGQDLRLLGQIADDSYMAIS